VLQTLRRRLQGEREGGFTLIELMVVVLIIAILIAIAIPTFLGARTRAQNRAVQANLRNALTVEKSYYTDAQLYSSDVTATGPLKLGEPVLTYVADGSMTAATAGNVYVSVPSTNTVGWGPRAPRAPATTSRKSPPAPVPGRSTSRTPPAARRARPRPR